MAGAVMASLRRVDLDMLALVFGRWMRGVKR